MITPTDKIKDGLKEAVKFAKGEDTGARVTHYPIDKESMSNMTSQEASDILAIMMRKLEQVMDDFEERLKSNTLEFSSHTIHKMVEDMQKQHLAMQHGRACLLHAISEGTIIPQIIEIENATD